MQSISNRAVVYDFSVDRVDSVIFLRLFCGNLDGFRADGSHFVIRCGYMECLLKFIRGKYIVMTDKACSKAGFRFGVKLNRTADLLDISIV